MAQEDWRLGAWNSVSALLLRPKHTSLPTQTVVQTSGEAITAKRGGAVMRKKTTMLFPLVFLISPFISPFAYGYEFKTHGKATRETAGAIKTIEKDKAYAELYQWYVALTVCRQVVNIKIEESSFCSSRTLTAGNSHKFPSMTVNQYEGSKS